MAWRKKRGKKYLVEWRFPVGDPTARTYSRGGFGTAAAADAFIKVVDDVLATGRNWEPPRAAEKPTLNGALLAYLEHLETRLTPGTVRVREMSLELFRRFVGTTTPIASAGLDVLTKSLLSRFLAWLRSPASSKKGSRNEDTVRKCVEHVQLFWAWAVDDDTFGEATPPLRKISDELRQVRAPRTPTRAPTWANMDACIVALAREIPGHRVRRDVPYLVIGALMERCTGLRVSQVGRLLVGDIDLARGELVFRGALGKSLQERAGRIIPLAPVLLQVLADLVAGADAGALLVPRVRELSEQNHRLRMREAWAATGVDAAIWAGRPNHCMRKGFSSELARAGVSVEIRDILTGHATGIAGIYTDQSALPLREAVGHVAALSPEALAVVNAAVSTTIKPRETARTRSGPNAG